MYKCKHFVIEELVSKELFELLHEDVLWSMFDENLLRGLDYIKENFPDGAMTINNWKWGGSFNESGLRMKTSQYYSEGSMHSIGKAVDFRFSKYDESDVYNWLQISDIDKYFNRMEHIDDTKGKWIHLDTKKVESNGLYIFRA